ncbi:hypothetical protein PR003_g15412 [Phytophthora rubi]|uniref:Uncharacterized protein n=1 Tax=Phytophthora rubi TaxID=129364 RepID=A0A6A3L5L4_9STRA|nr:hypothetical protein PR001_g15461 [Phytophthora rubi]KAE9330053.1 hypothetical protein PR003_g15412 [Phytophthora rubi]
MVAVRLLHRHDVAMPPFRTFNEITRTSGANVSPVPEWFISSDDVDFDTKQQFNCGSYGVVTRGTWGKASSRCPWTTTRPRRPSSRRWSSPTKMFIHSQKVVHAT